MIDIILLSVINRIKEIISIGKKGFKTWHDLPSCPLLDRNPFMLLHAVYTPVPCLHALASLFDKNN